VFHFFAPRLNCRPNEDLHAPFLQIDRAKRKTPPGRPGGGHAENSTDGKAGTLVARRGSARSNRSVFGANLHGLHAGLGFGLGLEYAVVDDGRCGGRLLVDDGALLARRVPHDIVLGGHRRLREGRSGGERQDSAGKQKLLHVFPPVFLSTDRGCRIFPIRSAVSERHEPADNPRRPRRSR